MTIWWALVGLAIFLIGLTKSGFGSGAGLMIVPMTAIALRHVPGFGGEMALPLLLPLLLVGDVIAIWQYRRQFSMPIIYRLGPGTIVGVILGTLPLGWFASHRHTPSGTNEAYAYSYLFVYELDVPANARTLTLPNNDSIRIMAITGSNENGGIKPAHPLYDTLERNP